ncbi:MAG: hypothetical protein KKD44_17685 [Proteobacteria bacterium]|nr:hypothetical protein [Pseudomonadota bacterium]
MTEQQNIPAHAEDLVGWAVPTDLALIRLKYFTVCHRKQENRGQANNAFSEPQERAVEKIYHEEHSAA